jgi:nucleoside transporter
MSRILNFQLSVLFFLQFFLWGSWYVTLGTYLLETLEFSGREVGLVYGATAIAATVSPFLLGLLADRFFNLERLLSVLHLCGGGVMLIVSFIEHFAWFYPILIAYALLYIPTFSLSNALAFHHLSNAARDFPRVRVWGTIGWVLAGVLVGWLEWEDTSYPMQLAAGASLVLGLFCFLLPSTPPQARKGKLTLVEILGPEVLALFKKRYFTVLVVCLTLISIPSGYYYSFVNPFLNELGMQNAAGKMSLGQVSEMAIMLLLPFFFTRFSFKWIISIGLFAWGARYLLFAWGGMEGGRWMLYTGILLHGFAFNFAILAAQIYIDRIVPAHVKSTAQGFMAQVTLGIGALIGAFVAGETVNFYTATDGTHLWQQIWLVPGVFGLLVTIGFMVFFKGRKKNT